MITFETTTMLANNVKLIMTGGLLFDQHSDASDDKS